VSETETGDAVGDAPRVADGDPSGGDAAGTRRDRETVGDADNETRCSDPVRGSVGLTAGAVLGLCVDAAVAVLDATAIVLVQCPGDLVGVSRAPVNVVAFVGVALGETVREKDEVAVPVPTSVAEPETEGAPLRLPRVREAVGSTVGEPVNVVWRDHEKVTVHPEAVPLTVGGISVDVGSRDLLRLAVRVGGSQHDWF
jgi:hypothetical protein